MSRALKRVIQVQDFKERFKVGHHHSSIITDLENMADYYEERTLVSRLPKRRKRVWLPQACRKLLRSYKCCHKTHGLKENKFFDINIIIYINIIIFALNLHTVQPPLLSGHPRESKIGTN
jgi:hypothetical protein